MHVIDMIIIMTRNMPIKIHVVDNNMLIIVSQSMHLVMYVYNALKMLLATAAAVFPSSYLARLIGTIYTIYIGDTGA